MVKMQGVASIDTELEIPCSTLPFFSLVLAQDIGISIRVPAKNQVPNPPCGKVA